MHTDLCHRGVATLRHSAHLYALIGSVLGAVWLTGCTTYAPRYDEQGRYVGEQEVTDSGKVVQGLGYAVGGLPGLMMQGMGRQASKEQQRRISEQRGLHMQNQIEQLKQELSILKHNQGHGYAELILEPGFGLIAPDPGGVSDPLYIHSRRQGVRTTIWIEKTEEYTNAIATFRNYYSHFPDDVCNRTQLAKRAKWESWVEHFLTLARARGHRRSEQRAEAMKVVDGMLADMFPR